jgi:methylthioribose-1-phosphate isomerase
MGIGEKSQKEMNQQQTLEAIKYQRGHLQILNQLLIPKQFVYENVNTVEKAYDAIKQMKVRGAPAIAIVAMLSIAVEANQQLCSMTDDNSVSVEQAACLFMKKLDYLAESRPTAVNLFTSVDQLKTKIFNYVESKSENKNCRDLFMIMIHYAEALMESDVKENASISEYGSQFIMNLYPSENRLHVLTHCNTGALATMKYGTALGVIRFLHNKNVIEQVYCTETRPYNQGARLTAFELVYEKIPATLICDSAVSYLFQTRKVHAVVVGADRVCSNGDTANKIGTYQIALSAMYHEIPFFVAAPSTSIDLGLDSGDLIKIEERSANEITNFANNGERAVVEGINVWNPGFDVTPARLITGGIITEFGVITLNKKTEQFDVRAFLEKHGK